MSEGWRKRTGEEIAGLYESPVPIVAEWHDGGEGELTLYADGLVEAEGGVPAELLGDVLATWHAHRRAAALRAAVAPRWAAG